MTMLFAVLAVIVQVLVIGFILSKYGIQILNQEKRGKSLFLILGLVLSAAGMNLLMVIREYTWLQVANQILMFTLLIILAGIDYRSHRIPNRLLLAGLIIRTVLILTEILLLPETWKQIVVFSVISMVISLLFMLLLTFLTKHGIGYGDVKLFAWLGFCLGLKETYYILFYSTLLAAVVGIFLMVMKKTDRKARLPFAPFVLGGYYAVFWMLS